MQCELGEEQWRASDTGELYAPDGTRYLRGSTRTKRKAVDALVSSGSPVVTYWPGGLPEHTHVVWHDGEDAQRVWHEARPALMSGPVRMDKGTVATAGIWNCDAGDVIVFLTWHH